jgi:hypothetical protein
MGLAYPIESMRADRAVLGRHRRRAHRCRPDAWVPLKTCARSPMLRLNRSATTTLPDFCASAAELGAGWTIQLTRRRSRWGLCVIARGGVEFGHRGSRKLTGRRYRGYRSHVASGSQQSHLALCGERLVFG